MATIRRRGPHQYQSRVRLRGYPPLEKTLPTRREAEAWGAETEHELLRGTYKWDDRALGITLSAALNRYAKEVTPHKKSAAHERSRLRLWQRNPLAVRPLGDIRGADLARHRDARSSAGISANTIRIELALISHLYEVARKDWGYEALTNPVRSMRMPKVPRGRDRRLFEGEESLLLAHCMGSGDARLAAVISLAIHTAMRRGEMVSLKWKDVDSLTRIAYLHDTKNGTARSVPLSTHAMAAMGSLRGLAGEKREVVGVHPDVITYRFALACKACGIVGLRFHDLRHEATTRLFEKGLSVMEVSAVTGHKSLQMLKRYTHLRPADLLAKLG